ncbi:MAG: hypothetical protein CFE23_08085 [Flavobacterium sp. BFFFF1]|uniref:CotH kinase family protein n=1 Tax=Flavobacterium sp. BFFFF1 TaxID=2015557 RepID=UPI000BDC33DE|nr:CotH kinase family protein [Flavobacterium sp. BFFFF1]OYU80672.1 MAG: hypothetical protein CFE23_08085 [Flavobacterium sp. BFFFF1]
MKKMYSLFLLIVATYLNAQTFNGSTGSISDDGTVNYYTSAVSGLSTNLNESQGVVQVCLDISHTYDSDLNVFLEAPDGTTINLFSGIGGDGHNFSDTCLNQDADTAINSAAAPFTGLFKPMESIGNVNNNQNGNGTWKLRIVDTYPFADTGTVNSWSISFAANAPTPFVFTESNLPIVLIDTNGETIPDEPKIPGLMAIIDNGPGQLNHITDVPNNFNGNIGIEMRGNYSQGLPQKPYKFETRDSAAAELNVSLLGMPEEHDWCLISNYNDKVFMRNTLAYQLFTDMGHYAPRSRYCEVVLNGVYQGVYMLMESIKRDNNRVDIAKLEVTENTGLNLTGGYIIKNDYWNDTNSWLLNYHPIDHPDFDVHLVYDYPKEEDITAQQKTYIQTFTNNLETALYGPDFADPVNGYAKFLDVDSFIDYFIVNELARNNDGFKKSSYFHKDKDSNTTLAKLKAGPVWDFDWAWKNIDECAIFAATDGSGWAHQINDCYPDVNSPGWFVRLLQDTAFQNKLRCRWEYFRATIMSDTALETYIDDTAAYLNNAQARHFTRWENLGVSTGTPEVDADPSTFDGQIAKFKNWIALRLAWLDANMPGNAVNCNLGLVQSQVQQRKLYPNPVKDVLHISAKTNNAQIEIYDITGKLMVKTTSESNDSNINLAAFSNGIYNCRISDGNTITVEKVVVMH